MYTVEPWCRIVSHSSTLSEFDTLAVENNAKSYTIQSTSYVQVHTKSELYYIAEGRPRQQTT